MGYVERHLLPNEHVVYKTRLHWVLYVKPALLILLGAVSESVYGAKDPGEVMRDAQARATALMPR